MTDGFAQASGRPVLVDLHAASGSGNALGALTNAVSARTPLVLLAGQQVWSAVRPEANLAGVDAPALMKPLVGWAAEPACAEDVARALAQAVFEARLRRRPTYLSVPYDDWSAETDDNAADVLDRRVERAGVPDDAQGRRLVFSAMVLVYAYATSSYPASVRSTALGSASGIGRIGSIVGPSITGALVASGVGHPWGFYFFAAVAALGLPAVTTLPRVGGHASAEAAAPAG